MPSSLSQIVRASVLITSVVAIGGSMLELKPPRGVDFTLQNSPTPQKYLIETMPGGVVAFDYDGDGLLDLFVGGYYAENIDLWHLTTTRIMPDSFEYAKNGGRKYLFHNLGNGKFEEVSAKVGIDSHRWALAASAADLRGTGPPAAVTGAAIVAP